MPSFLQKPAVLALIAVVVVGGIGGAFYFARSNSSLPSDGSGDSASSSENHREPSREDASEDGNLSEEEIEALVASRDQETEDKGAKQVLRPLSELVSVLGTSPVEGNPSSEYASAILHVHLEGRKRTASPGEDLTLAADVSVGSARLISVLRDRVVFEYRGKEVELFIVDDEKRAALLAENESKGEGVPVPPEPGVDDRSLAERIADGSIISDIDWSRFISAADRQTAEKLRETLMDLQLKQGSALDLAAAIREATGLNVIIDPSVDPDDQSVAIRVNELSAWNTLHLGMSNSDAMWKLSGGAIQIQSREQYNAGRQLQTYDISDLDGTAQLRAMEGNSTPEELALARERAIQAQNEIRSMISSNLSPGTWGNRDETIKFDPKGRLLVSNQVEQQLQVARLLQALRDRK